MMTRKITIMALIASVVLGVAATEGFNAYRQSHDRRIQERANCKVVANTYLRENHTVGVIVMLRQMDYSPARDSCVAELETSFPTVHSGFETVQDLLSGETLFSIPFESNETIPARVALSKLADAAFYDAMGDTSEAEETKEAARAYAAANHLTGATAFYPNTEPSNTSPNFIPDKGGSIENPNDWQTVPDKEWDAQGKPIASPKQKTYLDPNTGEPIQAPASQHKSATPSGP